MTTRTDIRIRNLRKLIDEAGGSQAELARFCGTSRTYISQILHGFEGTTGKGRSMGDRMARKLEKGMNKPVGWMDKDHGVPEPAQTTSAMAMEWVPVTGSIKPDEDDWSRVAPADSGKIHTPTDDPDAYALEVQGAVYMPAIRDGWYIIVEPGKPLQPGEMVLVRAKDETAAVCEMLYNRKSTLAVADLASGDRTMMDWDHLASAEYVGFIVSPSKIIRE